MDINIWTLQLSVNVKFVRLSMLHLILWYIGSQSFLSLLWVFLCVFFSRDIGHEGFNPQLSGQEGRCIRPGETRPAQRPQEPRLYPSSRNPADTVIVNQFNSN